MPHNDFKDLIAAEVDRAVARRAHEIDKKTPRKVWLSTAHAAAWLDCDIDWLEKLRREGRGPKFRKRAARFVRYHVDDLDAFMREAPEGGGSDASA